MKNFINLNIFLLHKLPTYVYYKGLLLHPSKHADLELLKYGLRLSDCKKILENGYEVRKREKNTEEKWLGVGKKIYNIVIMKTYSFAFEEEIYLIKHVGRFTK